MLSFFAASWQGSGPPWAPRPPQPAAPLTAAAMAVTSAPVTPAAMTSATVTCCSWTMTLRCTLGPSGDWWTSWRGIPPRSWPQVRRGPQDCMSSPPPCHASHSCCIPQRLHSHMPPPQSLSPSSGYPFDLVPPRAPLTSYAVLVYHLPLSIAFTVRRRAPFVWGGCMLLRARGLVGDPQGVLQVGRGGGGRGEAAGWAWLHVAGYEEGGCFGTPVRAARRSMWEPRRAGVRPRACRTLPPPAPQPLHSQAWSEGSYSDDLLLAAKCLTTPIPASSTPPPCSGLARGRLL